MKWLKIKKMSKGERLIYIIIFLWIVFGLLGIKFGSNLAQIAGYYASLTVFVATYLWGEWKRTSKSTPFFRRGRTSTREIVIYVTVGLWILLGLFGIIFGADINQLTVYFAALTPFVSSYIIYKTTKGNDLPIFDKDGDSHKLIDKAKETASMDAPGKTEEPVLEETKEGKEVKPEEKESDVEEDEVF